MAQMLLPVPHVPQRQPGECLAACAAMLLLYVGHPVNYEQLLRLLRVKPGIGAPISNVRHLEKMAVEITYRQGVLSDLDYHLGHNQPCLVPVQTGELPYWDDDTFHAIVVAGQDDAHMYLNDPVFPYAPIQVSRGDFDLAWLARDEYYAVITPRI